AIHQYTKSVKSGNSNIKDSIDEINKCLRKQTATSVIADRDYFNCIQFTKPQITINELNIWGESFDSNTSNFLSIESNVYFGTSAASHAKVEKIIKLFKEKKKEIDKEFESQPAWFIGLDFHKSSSMPHISCLSTTPLDILILKKLERLFDNEFEIVSHVIAPTNDEDIISSGVKAKAVGEKGENLLNVFQDFNISAYIHAKVDPLPNKRSSLKFSIDVNDCRMGPMLSDKWRSLCKLGYGYFLDSVEIWVIPIEDESMPNKLLYELKEGPWPQQFNTDVDISKVNEYNNNISASINKDPGVTLSHTRKNGQEIKFATKEWALTVDGSCSTGLGWIYQYTAEDLNRRRNFAPGKHSCYWETLKSMSGFQITIKQVICCKITDGWRKLKPYTKSKLMQLCPKMSHTIKMTFNNLKTFNEDFENLMKSKESHEDLINVALKKKSPPKVDPNVRNVNFERSVKVMTQITNPDSIQ
ncbi:11067_t:CDS:2, partial [Diversispora eburnea]